MMKKKWLAGILALACTASVAGCGGNNDSGSSSVSSVDSGSSSSSSSTSGGASSSEASGGSASTGDKDPLGKFDEPVTLTAVLSVSTPDPGIDPDVKKPEDNYFLEVLRDQLNIEIDYIWAVPEEQFAQKMSIAMTSDDLPDILTDLTQVQYATLLKNDRLADLTGALDYTAPTLMEYWQRIPEIFNIYNVDGKQLGLPQYWDPRRSATLLYVRQDWLDKLGLSVPTTMDELKAVAEAFVNQDPDGNGEKDTMGLMVAKSNAANYASGNSVSAYLQSFGAYPNAWLDDGSGNLIPGVIQPEVKEGLAWMRDMYAAGLIDPEFVVKDGTKNTETIVSGKCGLMYSQWWAASTSPFQNLLKDPTANWVTVNIPGVGGPGKTAVPRVSIATLTALNSKAQDKAEAFIKMENFAHYWEDYTFEDYAGNFTTKLTAEIDPEKRKTRDVWQWRPSSSILDPFDINSQYEVSNEAWAKQDPSMLTIGKTHDFYKQFAQYDKMKTGEIPWANELSGFMARARTDGSWKTTKDVFEAGNVVYSEDYGEATKSQQTKGSTLTTMAEELFVKIVMGEAPLDDFDSFVTSWKKLGGDAITEEVNARYQEQKNS